MEIGRLVSEVIRNPDDFYLIVPKEISQLDFAKSWSDRQETLRIREENYELCKDRIFIEPTK